MENLLGLGVFGTFGQPYGFQQAFSFDVEFSKSLDLDNEEIALFPGTELYSVKREFVNGVYSIAFCLYAHAREMNANRNGTFIGSAIVLQQVYVDPNTIYKLLRELHDDIVNNAQNLSNNTIQVRQAVNLNVKEPAQFQTVKFNTKTIENTPYYSTRINPQKKFFIHPGSLDNTPQVVRFFDEALKSYKDAETLYFSFSDKISHYVNKKAAVKVIEWDDFTSYRDGAPKPAEVVPSMPKAAPVPEKPVPQAPPAAAVAPVLPAEGTTVPLDQANREELQKMVDEYDKLIDYSKQMRDKLDSLLLKGKPVTAEITNPVPAAPVPAPAPMPEPKPTPPPVPLPAPEPVPAPAPKTVPAQEPISVPKPAIVPPAEPEPEPAPAPKPPVTPVVPKPEPAPAPKLAPAPPPPVVPKPEPTPAPKPVPAPPPPVVPKPEPAPVPPPPEVPKPEPAPAPKPAPAPPPPVVPKPEPTPAPKPAPAPVPPVVPKPEPVPAPKPAPAPAQPAPAPKPAPVPPKATPAPAPKPAQAPVPPRPEPKPQPAPKPVAPAAQAPPYYSAKKESAVDEIDDEPIPFYKKKGVIIGFVLILVIGGAGAAYIYKKHGSKQTETWAASTTDSLSMPLSHDSAAHTAAGSDAAKPAETAATPPPPEPAPARAEEKPVEKPSEKPAREPIDLNTRKPKVAKETAKPVEEEQTAPPHGKELNPKPNGELSESEVNDLNQFGIKNMFLSELTAMIMQKFPSVGNVYEHQAKDYAVILMQVNKGCFKKTAGGYVCITDALHHIPVHK